LFAREYDEEKKMDLRVQRLVIVFTVSTGVARTARGARARLARVIRLMNCMMAGGFSSKARSSFGEDSWS
jgi:hypothetical protein